MAEPWDHYTSQAKTLLCKYQTGGMRVAYRVTFMDNLLKQFLRQKTNFADYIE
ncbi:MAG: hypothetical protein Q9215_006692 [Flavoplaca cf. flavocitrina]